VIGAGRFRPSEGPDRLVTSGARIANLVDGAVRVRDSQASMDFPLADAAGLVALRDGSFVALGRSGPSELELLQIDGAGRTRRRRYLAHLPQGGSAYLFDDGQRVWTLCPGASAELQAAALGEGHGRVEAAWPLGLEGPAAMARIAGGDFIAAGLGWLLRITPPIRFDDGGLTREVAAEEWQRDLRQLCPIRPTRLLARGPAALHVLDDDLRRVATASSAGEVLVRVAGGERGALALSHDLPAGKPGRWMLTCYDVELKPRWERELDERWSDRRIDLALGAEQALVLAGPDLWRFDAADGKTIETGA
jgi:hypothetical protein